MATKILCVSLTEDNDNIDLLRFEKRVNTYKALSQPTWSADLNTLGQACRWADQIFISSEFPSAAYHWAVFPKVQKRYLNNVIKRDADRVLDIPGGARVAYKNIRYVVEEGVTKCYLSYVAVPEDEISKLENELFAKYTHKIRRITTLPVALCAVLIQTEKPAHNFMLTWVGEKTTVMAISNPTGEVYVARHIPVGVSQQDLDDPAYMERFSDEIRRDIDSTSLFHSQTFPNVDCQTYYMIGKEYLRNIFSDLPLPELSRGSFTPQIHFGLPQSPLLGLQDSNLNEAAHIAGSLLIQKEFNLIAPKIRLNRKLERTAKTAILALAALILLAGVWLFQVDPVSSEKIDNFKKRTAEYQQLQTEVSGIQKKVEELSQFSGWKNFYENTYKNQPAWNLLFFDIAKSIPPNIVINEVRVTPGEGKEIHGWNGIIVGYLNGQEWNNGLELLREFGSQLHSSPHFNVEKVDYTPVFEDENESITNADFEFQVHFQLTPQDKIYEN
jgi:hypothetical protein